VNNVIAVLGAGGHGKCIYECIKMQGFKNIGFFDDDKSKLNHEIIDGIKVIGSTDKLLDYGVKEIIVAIGDNRVRLEMYLKYKGMSYQFPNAIHCRAYISEFAKVGQGNFIMGSAIINPGAVVGDYCIINTSATVGHDTLLEEACQIGPGVNVAGHCSIMQGSFIGIGAKVAPGVTIGAWSVVGAGSVVLNDIPDNTFFCNKRDAEIRNIEQKE
jgi:UDP-perosamine 4-acetyltransferase